MTETFDPRALATRLHSLRQAGRQEATDAFALPADLHQAMEAQNLLTAADGISSNAWKVHGLAAGPGGHRLRCIPMPKPFRARTFPGIRA